MSEHETETERRAAARRRPRRPSRLRERSLLRNPLPLAAAAITILLVTLALLAARLQAGADPAFHPSTLAGAVSAKRASSAHGGSGSHLRTIVRTTASGRTITETVRVGGGSSGAAGERSAQGAAAPVRTRSSGGAGGESEGPDD